MNLSYNITGKSVSVLLKNRFRIFPLDTTTGLALVAELKKTPHDVEAIASIIDVPLWATVKNFGRVVLDDRDQIRLDGEVVDFGLVSRLKAMLEGGYETGPLIHYIERVAKNPDKSVAKDLHRFLEKGNLPLTPDGRFHAWKNVSDDLRSYTTGAETVTSIHADGTVETIVGQPLHPIGGFVTMRREDCDPNRHATCSKGLHACSYGYLDGYHGGKGNTLLVLIDPEDVTAIPSDASDTKLRCCKMEICAIVAYDGVEGHLSPVVENRYHDVNELAHSVVADDEDTAEPKVYNSYHDAFLEGKTQGVDAAYNYSDDQFEPDFEYHGGDSYADAQEEGVHNAYICGFYLGYCENFSPGSYISDSVTLKGKQDAENSFKLGTIGHFDLDDIFSAQQGAHDGEMEDAGEIFSAAYRYAYTQTFVKLYVETKGYDKAPVTPITED